jgi:L-threonylcarbamoyladenylate synthase
MRKIDIKNPDCLNEIVKVLKAGGIVMHPTETCYGFAVDIFNKRALDKLYEIKGRDDKSPVSILVDSYEMAELYGVFSPKAVELAKKYWPGPLSLVVPRTHNLPKFLNKGQDFVSIRVSGDDFCRKIPYLVNGPVSTTSANKSKFKPLYSCDDVSQFGEDLDKIDLIVDGGVIPEIKPSTIAKVDSDIVTILRQGETVVE